MMFLTSILGSVATAAPVIRTDDLEGSGFWLPNQASTVAGSVDDIFDFIMWLNVIFFVLIVALMVWFTFKYRRPEGEKAQKAPSHHTPLELTWTIIPMIIVVVLFWVGMKAYADLQEPPKNAYEVHVTGVRWNWTFKHPAGAQESNYEFHVPAGRPVKLLMGSSDVLHSLYIPAFRVKQDVVPGRTTYLWFTAENPGTYQLFCTEYCGADHSRMTAIVHVMPEDEFETWLADASEPFKDVAIEDYPAKFLEVVYPRCASCHNLDAVTKQGPGFAVTAGLWGKERPLQSGSALVDENYIRRSILDPQSELVPDMPGKMTSFQGLISEEEILSAIEFFKRYDEFVDENGNKIAR